MGIILFLVDTSASMNQKTFLGTSYLDVAKGAIDTFMKYRARDPASAGDHYMLVSFDDPPTSIKVGWENHGIFMSELKNLQAIGLSTFNQSLKESLYLLNINRLHTGIDHYGQGRNPFFLEPAVIIALTDGGKFNNSTGNIEDELVFPRNPTSEGSELTKELFRWDQRIFTILLQLPGLPGNVIGNTSDLEKEGEKDPIFLYLSALCEYTGGKCYTSTNLKSLSQCMESLCQKLHPGVVLNFRKIGSTDDEENNGWSLNNYRGKSRERSTGPPSNMTNGIKGKENSSMGEEGKDREESPPGRPNAWHNTRKMIYVRPNPKTNIPSGHWPIPESFWPEVSMGTLTPRDVHPIVWFNAVDIQPHLLENFAFDKYELEPSPLTQHILEKRNPTICWQVFINDSSKDKGIHFPFGYLKASSSGNFVNLFVMPFNYTRLLPLIEELQRQQLRPSSKWRSEFADYITTVPSYYAQPLRKALQLMGAHPSLVPESFDGQMSYSITNYLRKLKKQAKIDVTKLSSQIVRNRGKVDNNNAKKPSGIVDLGDGISVAIGSTDANSGEVTSQSYRNPFDIPRRSLLGQVARMRANFLYSSTNTPHLIEEVSKHEVPIGQMGNYQKHLKRINPLRELDTGDVRTQLFGNPFKLEKPSDKRGPDDYGNVADEMMVERLKRPGSPARNPRKRKLRSPSPLPSSPSQNKPTLPDPGVPKPNKIPKDTQIKQESDNGVKFSKLSNSTHPLPLQVSTIATEDVEIVEIDSSTQLKADSTDQSDSMEIDLVDPLDGSSKDLIRQDPVTPPVDSNSHSLQKLPKIPHPPDLIKNESSLSNSKKDIPVLINRKRTPSPTSFSLPSSKRPNKDTTKPPNIVIEGLPKSNNKSPSPSPLIAPLRQTGLSSASQVLNEEFKRKQTTENLKLKQLITKEIRKHSKNYDPIFQHLDNIQGTADTKRAFINDVIKEAERFRKKQLIQLLEDWTLKLGPTKTGNSDKSRSGTSTNIKTKLSSTNR